MLLHGGGGVQSGQRVVKLLQVRVAVPSVVQIMAQAGDQQTFLLLTTGGRSERQITKITLDQISIPNWDLFSL